jgi:hypothetical protein
VIHPTGERAFLLWFALVFVSLPKSNGVVAMMTVKELRRWIDTLNPDNRVAIDEGGLTVVELTPDGTETGAYLELGGVPLSTPAPGQRK